MTITETISSLVAEYSAANSGVKSAASDLTISKLLAKDGRDGPERVKLSDDVYDAHQAYQIAIIRSNKAYIEICRTLESKDLDFESRATLINALREVPKVLDLRGDTAALAVAHG